MLPCCCGHKHEENSPCSDEDCPCAAWHWYDHKHWNPEHRKEKMHTFNSKNGVHIHFNPDGSGHVGITKPNGEMILVQCEDLIDFVALLVRNARIEVAEDEDDAEAKIADIMKLSTHELLGLRP